MSIKFHITPEDYVAAGLLNVQITQRSKIIHYIIDPTFVILGLIAWYFERHIITAWLIGAVIISNLLPLLFRNLLLPWLLKRDYKKYNKIKKPTSIILNNGGIKFESEDEFGTLEWNDIYKWRKNSKYILIYLSPQLYHLVPKRIIEDGFPLNELEEALTKNVGIST